MPKQSHNDAANHIDAFKQDDFINQVCEVIKDCTPPKGIAINGYWGTGKTSTLLQLRNELIRPKNHNIIPIWFEAWRYQSETVPIVALLQEIRAQLNIWQKAFNVGKKSAVIIGLGILGAIDVIIKIASEVNGAMPSSNLNKLPEIIKQLEDKNLETRLASQHTSSLLEQAIAALGKGDKRLVIFIDDLDRCLPEVALKLLEGIKVYLNLNNCVLVFGMDQRQIEEALAKALNSNGSHQAREYLEKICQDIHHLPIPNQYTKADYLIKLLRELELVSNDQLTVTEKDLLQEEHLTKIKTVLYAYDCLPANPRKIKALSNRLVHQLRKGCIKKADDSSLKSSQSLDRRYMLLVAMTIIYNFHRQLNEQLEKNPQYIDQVIIYVSTPPAYPLESISIYEPMRDIAPSYLATNKRYDNSDLQELPTNPSDSNIFRLYELFKALVMVTDIELKPFLNSHS